MTMASEDGCDRLVVALDNRAYDIVVGPGLLATAGEEILPLLRRRHVVVVTDENVAPHWLAPLRASLAAAGITQHTVVLPPGEETKDLVNFGRLAEEILACGVERGSTLVALGGGVVGDLTGFAAATLLRGIDFVQIPTTLLAQVDSSVGGKTGINTRLGKNLIGAFYQPRLVLADTDVLASLPRRELLAGYAETVKYGLIRDAEFFAWCERQGNALLALAPEPLRHAIVTSCGMKAVVVAADEREEGERALLNFGHTFGHALETETGFSSRLLHGEAVALGMALAFDFAARLGIAAPGEGERVRRHFAQTGLPTQLADAGLTGIPADRLLGHMSKDKKVRDGKITLILPRRIGDVFVMRDAPVDKLRAFLSEAA
ncbi:MAG: 3-dehydroquinate synthase [Alphaproteobacteria bacterium]|nr:3-dehydroquinate synthase [Alphaproteobacteria bacterium]